MTVEILRLSGLRGRDPDQAVRALLADLARPDLSRLLVVDDTAVLLEHSAVYERLLTSRRLDHLLCLAVGPRAADSRDFRYPGNISGGQGSAVLWVSDPVGVDWRLAASAIARVHGRSSANGLHHLVELLSVDEVFDRVCDMARHVPGGVASPGIRLAGADDEAANFAAALVLAIQQFTGPGSAATVGGDEPFTALQSAPRSPAGLSEGGVLAQQRDGVVASAAAASEAASQLAGVGGLLGLRQPAARAHVVATGSALDTFRNRVTRLLRDMHAPGGLTERHRGRLRAAGVRLPDPAPSAGIGTADSGGPPGPDSERSAVSDAIGEAMRGGDTMPRVIRRLNLTASALDHGGNAAYLSEVARVCPPALSSRLAEPPAPRRPWRGLPAVGGLATLLASLAVGWNLAAGVACGLIIAVAWTWLTALAERRGTEGHAPVSGRVTATVVGAVLGIAAGAGAGAVLKPGPGPAAAGIIAAAVVAGAASIWSWRARVSAWRHELPLDEAAHAADALADLVVAAAEREWSGRNTMLDEVIRARIALDGISSQLTEHAEAVSESGSQAQASRAARLSESLMPGLHDLVRTVLTAGSVTASAGGRAAFEQAQAKTATLIKEWTQHALEHGVLAPVPFAAHAPFAAPAPNDTQYADETEIAEIIEAVRYDPREVMWQLCAPSDLNVLDVVDLPQLIAFAPRLTRQQLSDVLPADTVWTSSGTHVGLLRLVPLRAGIASASWTADEDHQELL